MGKPLSSAIGIDLGRFALKAVRLARAGKSFAFTHYAVRQIEPDLEPPALAREMRELLRDLGAKAAGCAVSIAHSDAILRTITQPETPPHLLREGLRINGLALLNQECRDYVLDCAEVGEVSPDEDAPLKLEATREGPPPQGTAQMNYLVTGVPESAVAAVDAALASAPAHLQAVHLAPLSLFHAFRQARPEVVAAHSFLLVDIGHLSSTIVAGARGQFLLVRSIDFGGNELVDALMDQGCGDDDDPTSGLETGDPASLAVARAVASMFAREIRSSIGFLEQQHENLIECVFVSGGPARSTGMVRLLGEELYVPCEAWDPLAGCRLDLSGEAREQLETDRVNLGIAAGSAIALLDPRDTATMNLYHETLARRRARQRHPAKIGSVLGGTLFALLAIYYLVRLAAVYGIESRAQGVAAQAAALEKKRPVHEARIAELQASLATAGSLVSDVENRFYWAPLLARILPAIPEHAQLVRLAGKLSPEPDRKCTLEIEGVVAGPEPRQAAEELRLAITAQVAAGFTGVSSRFEALEDTSRRVQVGGVSLPLASFTIDLTLDATPPVPLAEPPPDEPVPTAP